MDTFRDSVAGQILRFVLGSCLCPYLEDSSTFESPFCQPSSQNGNSPNCRDSTGDVTRSGKSATTQNTVDWYSDNDPENPHNWSACKKAWVSALLFAYTFSAYIGSSLYTASETGIMNEYHASQTVVALGLSLYVLGYGFAPMVLSPLSEIPAIGRNPPYVLTYIIFVVLCIGMLFVDSVASILVLRFLLGVFASPALATVGASYGDFFSPETMPYVIALWGGGATLGPALGPLVSGFAVMKMGWRWSNWELLWLSAPIAVLMLVLLPETSSETILLRRAKRLRLLSGNDSLMSASELRQSRLNYKEIAVDALIKPWEINMRDFAICFSTFYTALIYGIYYSFFESFPLVYGDTFGFHLGEVGLAFLSVLVGLGAAVVLLCCYFYFISPKQLGKLDPVPPEARIWPGLFATFLIPIGLFLFAWTSRKSVHWSVSMTGVAISMAGVFVITQCMFIYLPFSYPRYAGSLFAANGFARSVVAAAAILFSPSMFSALGVDSGVSLLAGLSVFCVFGIFYIYFRGGRLRQKSKFASH